ncbi:MAG: tetratricopeptide repeat protein [Chlamydiae bacterium]|nr:tetratricopeptide repeat protein [Chlamydiota bacterium]
MSKFLLIFILLISVKRAEVLIPKENLNRIQEIQYNIILSYYLGKKYSDVIATFEKSSLSNVDRSFNAFEDLLIILYESYAAVKDEEKAKQTLELLNSAFPKTEKKIELSTALQAGKIEELDKYKSESSSVEMIQNTYSQAKKSTGKAQLFNACLPGAGYLYVGQKKTAATSFLLNALFIAAAYQFFHKGYIAAGAITSSFEVGWYFGGIYGAGQEAKFYNERIYETQTTKVMQQEKLFPAFMLKYGF